MLLPALARAKSQSQETQCVNNMKELMLAAILYSDDNAGIWFPNQPGQDAWTDDPMSWQDSGAPWPATNFQVLTWQHDSPAAQQYQLYSFFVPYIQTPYAYKCPSDPSTANHGGPRCRTYAASQAVGTCWASTGNTCWTLSFGTASPPALAAALIRLGSYRTRPSVPSRPITRPSRSSNPKVLNNLPAA